MSYTLVARSSPQSPLPPAVRPLALFNSLPRTIFVHHTASSAQGNTAADAMVVRQAYDRAVGPHTTTAGQSSGDSDIEYSFLIGHEGVVWEGRGWDHVPAATYANNSYSIAICFIGNFQSEVPTQAALTAFAELVADGVRQGKFRGNAAPDVNGHRDVRNTACPGANLYPLVHNGTLKLSVFAQLSVPSNPSPPEVTSVPAAYVPTTQVPLFFHGDGPGREPTAAEVTANDFTGNGWAVYTIDYVHGTKRRVVPAVAALLNACSAFNTVQVPQALIDGVPNA